ncbi:hypothetical protein BDR07DRAFT_1377554 [Suillus spraguei]|nr:hypothetical protein BDR07DRAFT_1377554 [Suillus spraguei]
MTIVSNEPTSWPAINSYRVYSYFVVAAFVGLLYDWALTLGQEVELIWVRYLGILFASLIVLDGVPTIPLRDTGCWITFVMWNWINFVVFAMLWVIIITRLYAMYQRSRKILIFLIITFLAVNVLDGVINIMITMYSSAEELVLSGTYQCSSDSPEFLPLLGSIAWILATLWEVFALCLSVWISVKHFRELQQVSAGGVIGDCFAVLMRTHAFYFASLVIDFSPALSEDLLSSQICNGLSQILTVVQSFVLGPRLILGVREYNARLVADSHAATGMTSIAFQEPSYVVFLVSSYLPTLMRSLMRIVLATLVDWLDEEQPPNQLPTHSHGVEVILIFHDKHVENRINWFYYPQLSLSFSSTVS